VLTTYPKGNRVTRIPLSAALSRVIPGKPKRTYRVAATGLRENVTSPPAGPATERRKLTKRYDDIDRTNCRRW
jgi:hypothetical protein